ASNSSMGSIVNLAAIQTHTPSGGPCSAWFISASSIQRHHAGLDIPVRLASKGSPASFRRNPFVHAVRIWNLQLLHGVNEPFEAIEAFGGDQLTIVGTIAGVQVQDLVNGQHFRAIPLNVPILEVRKLRFTLGKIRPLDR